MSVPQERSASCLEIVPVPQMVHASCLEIEPVPVPPQVFRIGPPKHAYVYEKRSEGHYECGRGSDWAINGRVLHLVHDLVGGTTCTWIAYDAPAGAAVDEVLMTGIPVFRSSEAILVESWHVWESIFCSDLSSPIWRSTNLTCHTTPLR